MVLVIKKQQLKNMFSAIERDFSESYILWLSQLELSLQTLEHLNFGNIFNDYVKTMYKDIYSIALNYGNSGQFRRVRQGCSLITASEIR